MPRTQVIDGVTVALTAQEDADRDAYEAQALLDKPQNDWEEAMAGTDAIPRWAEDIFDALPLEIRDVVNPVTKKMINDKKALREIKPV